jgi:flagellar protein FlaI
MQIIEKYKIKIEKISMEVKISVDGGKKKYLLNVPEINPATKALLDEIKQELILEVAISTSEILDPKIIQKLKQTFKKRAELSLAEKLPHITEKTKDFLITILLNDMVGLGNIEFLLNDGQLEEIVITSASEPLRIYHKKHGWLDTDIFINTEAKIQNFSNIIARRVGRQITTLNPLLDAHLLTGDRANAVLYPVSTKGHTITIRKFARDPWTVTDFIKNNTCSSEVFALIWLAIQYEMNILISGGTASGKTSFLNVCMPFMPPNQRIISIEDTRELYLPEYLYWCPLTSRQPNPEGKGKVSMLDLLVNSLRMRPDRIILGEMRKKDQAEVLFEAMHTGHSVYATVHADTISETIKRLTNPPIEVPANLLGAVNLNVVMFRDRRRGIRRAFQIGEFLSSEDEGRTIIKPNILYRWKPQTDKIITHSNSLKLFEDLSRHTGMSMNEINKELTNKKKILDLLVKKNIRSIKEVGKVMNDYYLNPDSLQKQIKKR